MESLAMGHRGSGTTRRFRFFRRCCRRSSPPVFPATTHRSVNGAEIYIDKLAAVVVVKQDDGAAVWAEAAVAISVGAVVAQPGGCWIAGVADEVLCAGVRGRHGRERSAGAFDLRLRLHRWTGGDGPIVATATAAAAAIAIKMAVRAEEER